MDLTNFQKDTLKEVGNIGIGHAATALSKMVGNQVDIELPDLIIKNSEELKSSYDSGYLVNCSINGDISGNLAFMFAKNEVCRMIEILTMADKGSITKMDEMGKSALSELVNILSGAYLSSLSDLIQFNLMPNPPIFVSGNINDALKLIIEPEQEILEVQTTFKILNEKLSSQMCLMLKKSDMEKIISKLNS